MLKTDRYLFRGKRTNNGEWVYGYYMHACGNSDMLVDRTPSNPEQWVFENMVFDSHLILVFTPPDTQGWDYNEQVHFYKVIPETVGQFTGLFDKNGERIFEGDIMEEISGYKGVVKMVEYQLFNGKIYCWGYTGKAFCENNMTVTEKITGNIYDNEK